MPKRKTKRNPKPTHDFYSVGAGKSAKFTPQTDATYKFMDTLLSYFANKQSSSQNFSVTELIYTCDLRIIYAHLGILPSNQNMFLLRSAFIGSSVHAFINKLVNDIDEFQECVTEQSFRFNPFRNELTDQNDEYGIVFKPDLLLKNSDGYILIDFKMQFSESLKLRYEHRRQMLMYYWLLTKLGYKIDGIVLVYIPIRGSLNIVPIELRFTADEINKVENEVKERIKRVNESLKDENQMPMRHYGYWCESCPFRSYCKNDMHPLKLFKFEESKRNKNTDVNVDSEHRHGTFTVM